MDREKKIGFARDPEYARRMAILGKAKQSPEERRRRAIDAINKRWAKRKEPNEN